MSLDERKAMMSALVSANTNRAEKLSRTPCLTKLAEMGYAMTVWSARYGKNVHDLALGWLPCLRG